MRSLSIGILTGLMLAASSAPAAAQTLEERSSARDLIAKRGDTAVVVLATIKLRTTAGGRENVRDTPMQANAAILESNGLAVMALSQLDPSEMIRMMSAAGGGGMDVSTEASDLRMRLADGREVPAKIVLRDPDLDLAFLRPVEPLTAPLAALDGPAANLAMMDLVIEITRTGESTGWRPLGTFCYVQMTVDKPRRYFALSAGASLGGPIFDAAGKFAGILVRVGGSRTNPQAALLPADDIRDIAKQAGGK